jgi:hypothetical protein
MKSHPFKLQASLRALADSFSEGTLDSEEKIFDAASYMIFARLARRSARSTLVTERNNYLKFPDLKTPLALSFFKLAASSFSA